MFIVVKKTRNFYYFFHVHITCFHVSNLEIFYVHSPDFTQRIWKRFSREESVFHGHFIRFFHVEVSIFTDGNSKIFTQGNLFFTQKKKYWSARNLHFKRNSLQFDFSQFSPKNWTHLQFYKRNPFKNFSEQKKIDPEIWPQKHPLGSTSWRPLFQKPSPRGWFWKFLG